jgi:DNA-binding transcriptional LysR family regulator
MNIALADRQDNDVGDLLSRGGIRIPHLKLIVALDDYGQISAAASVMNMSQPAASRMLSEIETILEAPLCERLPRGVTLSPYGIAFAARARSILLELREAGREIRDLRSGTGGSVSIGAVTAPAAQIIIPAIRTVRTLFPRIHINLQVETSTELAKDLLASRLDFMLARIPDDMNPRQFEAREIGIERACLVVRHGHPLLQKPSVTLAELSDMEWVMQPPGSLLNRTVERLFLAASVPLPDRIVSTSSLLMTMLMVQASDAIAPMAADVASPFFAAGKQALAALPIGRDITVQPYSLITLRGRQLSPAAQTVCQAVIAEIDRQKA